MLRTGIQTFSDTTKFSKFAYSGFVRQRGFCAMLLMISINRLHLSATYDYEYPCNFYCYWLAQQSGPYFLKKKKKIQQFS